MAKQYDFDPRLMHPFTCMISGPTQSGKTQFVFRMIRERVNFITPPPERIVWCFGCYQETFRDLSDQIEFVEGMPGPDLLDKDRRTLIIIDDLMCETNSSVTSLFTKDSHHKNASVVYISQNLFNNGKENRNISLNTHYLILFKNPRDAAQISHLAKQIFPGRVKYLTEAFADATSQPYGYLLVDLKTTTPDELRLRTEIFPDENMYVYIYK